MVQNCCFRYTSISKNIPDLYGRMSTCIGITAAIIRIEATVIARKRIPIPDVTCGVQWSKANQNKFFIGYRKHSMWATLSARFSLNTGNSRLGYGKESGALSTWRQKCGKPGRACDACLGVSLSRGKSNGIHYYIVHIMVYIKTK